MKTILLTIASVLVFAVSGICQSNTINIKGLAFSEAFFISLTTDQMRNYIAFDTTITIEKGKVWNITSCKSFMVNDDHNPYENEVSLWINDQIIYYYKSTFDMPLWLPAGKYRIRLMSVLKNKNMRFISYLSGIEYTINE